MMFSHRNQQRFQHHSVIHQNIPEISYALNPQFQQSGQILHANQPSPQNQQNSFNNSVLIPISVGSPAAASLGITIAPMGPGGLGNGMGHQTMTNQLNYQHITAVPVNPQQMPNFIAPPTNRGRPQQSFVSTNNNIRFMQGSKFKQPGSGQKKYNSHSNQEYNLKISSLLRVDPPFRINSDFNEIFQFGKRLIFEFTNGSMFLGELFFICHYLRKIELIKCVMLRGPNENTKINLMKNIRSKPVPFLLMEIHNIHYRIPGINFDDFFFDDADDYDSQSDDNISEPAEDILKKLKNDNIANAEKQSEVKITTQLNVNAAEFRPGASLLPEVIKSVSMTSLNSKEFQLKPLKTRYISQPKIEKIEIALKSIELVVETKNNDINKLIKNLQDNVEIAVNFNFIKHHQNVELQTMDIYSPKLNKIYIFEKQNVECLRDLFENEKIRKIYHFNQDVKNAIKNFKFNATNCLDINLMFTRLYLENEDNVKCKYLTLLEMIEVVLNVKNDYIEYFEETPMMPLLLKKILTLGKMVIFLYEIYERLFQEKYYRTLFTSKYNAIETSSKNTEKLFEYNLKGCMDYENDLIGSTKEFEISYKIPKKYLKNSLNSGV